VKLPRALLIFSALGLCALLYFVVPRLVWDNYLRDKLFTPPPPSTAEPPVYPNAEQVSNSRSGHGYVHLGFVTSDKPEEVTTFYKEMLRTDGWVNPLRGGTYPPDTFEWRQAGPNGPTDIAFELTLSFTEEQPDKTRVDVVITPFNPIE
jgi:hypothetical protein